jgi:hypothetical protein
MASAPAHTEPRRRSLRARPAAWAVALIGVAIVAVAVWLLVFGGPGGRSQGPLESYDVSSIGIGRHAGETFGYGLAVAFNRGDEVAVLDRIEIVDRPPGLRVLETQVAGRGRENGFLASTIGPPERQIRDLHPVRGFRVPPDSTPDGEWGAELVFTLRADDPGRYAFTRVAVDYRVGDTEHRAVLRNGLAVCVTPRGEPRPRNCKAPQGL